MDRNHNERCDQGEPSGWLRLHFKRLATFDAPTGRLIESNCVHPVTSSTGSFIGGLFTMRDVSVGDSDEVTSTYQGDVSLKRTGT